MHLPSFSFADCARTGPASDAPVANTATASSALPRRGDEPRSDWTFVIWRLHKSQNLMSMRHRRAPVYHSWRHTSDAGAGSPAARGHAKPGHRPRECQTVLQLAGIGRVGEHGAQRSHCARSMPE